MDFFRSLFIACVDYKKRICISFHSPVQIKVSLVALTFSGWRGSSSPRSGSRACRPCSRPGPWGSASRCSRSSSSWRRRRRDACWPRNIRLSFGLYSTQKLTTYIPQVSDDRPHDESQSSSLGRQSTCHIPNSISWDTFHKFRTTNHMTSRNPHL